MKNKIIFLLLFFALILLYLLQNLFLKFVWFDPNVNNSVFVPLTKTIKILDCALKYSVKEIKSDKRDVKLIYENAYGSGFLKENPIPNDLDYASGVYLGEFIFDGKNEHDIAIQMANLMNKFQYEFYYYINQYQSGNGFYSKAAGNNVFYEFERSDLNIASLAASIPKVFADKDYVLYTQKDIFNENTGKTEIMSFPFVMKGNEVLLEDYEPIKLFTNTIKYSNKTRPIIREISIVTDFYADIKYNDTVKRVEIAVESFQGQRMQLRRRLFVPQIFVGDNSFRYLKKMDLLNDDNKYIETRLYNFNRYIQEINNLIITKDRPIKLIKRLLQATYILKPILDTGTYNSVISTLNSLLNKPEIILINDLQTSYSNLIQITSNPQIFFNIDDDLLDLHIIEIQNIVSDIEKLNFLDKNLVFNMKKFSQGLSLSDIESAEELLDFNSKLLNHFTYISHKMNDWININLPSDIYIYPEFLAQNLRNAGVHQIHLCWIDKDTIGIVEDNFTVNIPAYELKDMAKKNNLVDVNYKFIQNTEQNGLKVRYSVAVRYNSSQGEENNWQLIRKKLLKYRDIDCRIKRKFIFPKSFY